MPKVTQRDIVESVTGLRDTAKTIRAMITNGQRDKDGFVTLSIRPEALGRQADYLDQVAEELTSLVPEKPVTIPKG